MSDDDLDLIETEQLVDALHRRTGQRGGVLLVVIIDRSDQEEAVDVFWRGGKTLAKGMAAEAMDRLNWNRGRPADADD